MVGGNGLARSIDDAKMDIDDILDVRRIIFQDEWKDLGA